MVLVGYKEKLKKNRDKCHPLPLPVSYTTLTEFGENSL